MWNTSLLKYSFLGTMFRSLAILPFTDRCFLRHKLLGHFKLGPFPTCDIRPYSLPSSNRLPNITDHLLLYAVFSQTIRPYAVKYRAINMYISSSFRVFICRNQKCKLAGRDTCSHASNTLGQHFNRSYWMAANTKTTLRNCLDDHTDFNLSFGSMLYTYIYIVQDSTEHSDIHYHW